MTIPVNRRARLGTQPVAMGFENVGKFWTPSELEGYLATIQKPVWCKAITFHHTAVPSLEQRPKGWSEQHMKNLQSYYESEDPKNKKVAWSSGPHLFIDDDQAWGMCDFRQYGVHAVSFNGNALGIEVLGNYDVESPHEGRGLACWQTAAATGKVLLEWLGLPADQLHVWFHRDDPKTGKSCPGNKIDKFWVLELIQKAGKKTAQRSTAYKNRAIAV